MNSDAALLGQPHKPSPVKEAAELTVGSDTGGRGLQTHLPAGGDPGGGIKLLRWQLPQEGLSQKGQEVVRGWVS